MVVMKLKMILIHVKVEMMVKIMMMIVIVMIMKMVMIWCWWWWWFDLRILNSIDVQTTHDNLCIHFKSAFLQLIKPMMMLQPLATQLWNPTSYRSEGHRSDVTAVTKWVSLRIKTKWENGIIVIGGLWEARSTPRNKSDIALLHNPMNEPLCSKNLFLLLAREFMQMLFLPLIKAWIRP